ncbi:MAG TPA: hypothetical protein ENG29_00260 [Firmicutes bacterium]|nr:MAG: hypothetical protein DRH51_02290 [Candidatus Coatesbacteria bacterium]HDM42802.1 hypothetical protein [Bacillota bacterium]HEC80013.1 hypothetical protein [Bacillota bacterium]
MRTLHCFLIFISIMVSLSCSRSGLEKMKEECSADIKDVRVERADLFGVLIQVDVVISNPTPNTATIRRVDYDVYVEDKLVDTHSRDEYIELIKGGNTPLTVPINLSYQSIEHIRPDATGQRTVNLRIEGSIIMSRGMGKIAIDFDFEGPVVL